MSCVFLLIVDCSLLSSCALCTVHCAPSPSRPLPRSRSMFHVNFQYRKFQSQREERSRSRSEKREEQKSEVWSRAPSLAIVTTGLFFVSLCVYAGVVVTLRATAALVTILLYTTYNIQQSQSPAFFKGHEQARVSSTFP